MRSQTNPNHGARDGINIIKETFSSVAVAARKDDAPAAGQAVMTKVAGSMACSCGGGLIQTTSGRCQQRVLPLQRRG